MKTVTINATKTGASKGDGDAAAKRAHPVRDVVLVALFFSLIGLWYAGSAFLTHFSDGLPVGAAGGGVGHMLPGDQFEAFYRHVLPYYNLNHGQSLFFSGYQYNLGQDQPFVDGMIYLPFSLLVSALAFVIGPIAAYNLVAILSFGFCAVGAFLLGKEVSGGSRAGGWVAAAIFALLPFRVGFLFGEMFYATDMALIPLLLLLFLRYAQSISWRYAAGFGAVLLALFTANFALAYWFVLFFSPFFVAATVHLATKNRTQLRIFVPSALAMLPWLILIALYALHVKSVLSGSGLGGGQSLEEVRAFSPQLSDLTSKWNGIERTIYLGLAALMALAGGVVALLKRDFNTKFVLTWFRIYLAGAFLLIYALALGLTFDDLSGVPLYKAMFKLVPFANGSRTPGRLMAIVGACAAALAAISVAWAVAKLKHKEARYVATAMLVALVAVDFKFSNATMTTVNEDNRAYRALSGQQGSVLGLPMQVEADHYLNTDYQYYGLINDLRMVNGHSSTFPRDWDEFYAEVKSLNNGIATRDVLEKLRSRRVRFIAVHATSYEPSVPNFVVSMLNDNPALIRRASDHGVHVYEIADVSKAPKSVSLVDFLTALRGSTPDEAGKNAPTLFEAMGWYSREVYAGQRPFRWMSGTSAVVLARPSARQKADDVTFQYKCPIPGEELRIEGGSVKADVTPSDSEGWRSVVVDLPDGVSSAIQLRAPTLYTIPTDERTFGCMISDFSIK